MSDFTQLCIRWLCFAGICFFVFFIFVGAAYMRRWTVWIDTQTALLQAQLEDRRTDARRRAAGIPSAEKK